MPTDDIIYVQAPAGWFAHRHGSNIAGYGGTKEEAKWDLEDQEHFLKTARRNPSIIT